MEAFQGVVLGEEDHVEAFQDEHQVGVEEAFQDVVLDEEALNLLLHLLLLLVVDVVVVVEAFQVLDVVSVAFVDYLLLRLLPLHLLEALVLDEVEEAFQDVVSVLVASVEAFLRHHLLLHHHPEVLDAVLGAFQVLVLDP